ncbi:MAG TPA: DUF4956 domain-containing protein [Clostridiales bacterium]|nr:DUF4956 domain-containing protein [Clostridiales bacterium]
MFQSIFTNGSVTQKEFLLCLLTALISGGIFSTLCFFKSNSTKSFFIATCLVPVAVTMIIALVNGNLGIGVAIAGAFGLVRFRSAQGSAREICVIFISMASGLAFGMGYLAYGAIFLLGSGVILFVFQNVKIWEKKENGLEKILKISMPEDLDYSGVFEDIFEKYTSFHKLVSVKSVNMGSVFKATYQITLKDKMQEKEMLDDIRVRNGNLEILSECSYLKNSDL